MRLFPTPKGPPQRFLQQPNPPSPREPRLQRPSVVFLILAMIGCTSFRSPRQRIFDQTGWQTGWPPNGKGHRLRSPLRSGVH